MPLTLKTIKTRQFKWRFTSKNVGLRTIDYQGSWYCSNPLENSWYFHFHEKLSKVTQIRQLELSSTANITNDRWTLVCWQQAPSPYLSACYVGIHDIPHSTPPLIIYTPVQPGVPPELWKSKLPGKFHSPAIFEWRRARTEPSDAKTTSFIR